MSTPHKITLITSRIDLRGSAVSAFHLARGLRQRDFDVQVLCRGGSLLSLFRAHGIKTHTLEIYGDSILNIFTWRQLVSAIREHRSELLHFQHPNLPHLARLLSLQTQLPYAVTVHSTPPHKMSFAARRMLGVIAISEGIREEIVNETDVPREIVHVIQDGVELPERGSRSPEQARNAIPVIGAMNRLEENRGLRYLILAARKLADRGIDIHVVIVGEGPLEYALRRLVRDQGLTEQVTIAHPAGDYRKLLEMFDIFISTSLVEGLGIFCLEAMAHSRPVIATSVGGVFQYLRDGVNGFLVPSKDSTSLADRIVRLVERPDLRQRFGASAREIVAENYPLERNLDQTIAFYEEILERAEEARKLKAS